MARQPRSSLPPFGTYHVVNRGVEQRDIFLFGARSIEDESCFLDACAYVFDNPVRAGICELPGSYAWSGGDVFEGWAR